MSTEKIKTIIAVPLGHIEIDGPVTVTVTVPDGRKIEGVLESVEGHTVRIRADG